MSARHDVPSRLRRGVLNATPCEWRRCARGSNHITNFGVWTYGKRREMPRLNRCGITRWHRPPFGGKKL